jgi:Ku70/Ku80-like protein
VAPRAYWKGYLRLSLVSCPIQLFPATSEREKISFHQLNKKTGNRIRYKKVDAERRRVLVAKTRCGTSSPAQESITLTRPAQKGGLTPRNRMTSRSVVAIQCLRCRHQGLVSDETLVRFGLKPGSPISSFVKRLRCVKCGSGSVLAKRGS